MFLAFFGALSSSDSTLFLLVLSFFDSALFWGSFFLWPRPLSCKVALLMNHHLFLVFIISCFVVLYLSVVM